MTFSVLLVMSAAIGSDAYSIDRALQAALDYDERAYGQICRDKRRLTSFTALQARAKELNDKYVQRFEPETIILRNVDRRPTHACWARERFAPTISDWRHALDEIEMALNEAA